MNNELAGLSKESIEIARYLVKLAKLKEVKTYGKVREKMESDHGHTYSTIELRHYLDEINKVSYPCACVLLSVLVVNKQKRIPGEGFFSLAAKLRKEPDLLDPDSWESFFNKECERVYESARNKKLNFFTDEK